jgi:hypothetical protein
MKIFITLLENVNKSRTSANNLSLIIKKKDNEMDATHITNYAKHTSTSSNSPMVVLMRLSLPTLSPNHSWLL